VVKIAAGRFSEGYNSLETRELDAIPEGFEEYV